MYYRCSMFVIEDLNLEAKGFPKMGREGNRLTRNVWNRDLFVGMLQRRCNEKGVELVRVNPCYSSFIGNIQHPYMDATNASVEIGRRGLYRYEKGWFYPHVGLEDRSTLEARFGDVVSCSTAADWVGLYKSLRPRFSDRDFAQRLRAGLDDVRVAYTVCSMDSSASKVDSIIFKDLH
jgi:hypothetical protein